VALLKIYGFYTGSLVRDPYYWFWAVFFMLFWLFMGAFVYRSSMTKNALREELSRSIPPITPGFEKILEDVWSKSVVYYTGGWYGGVALYSLTAVSMGLVYYVYCSTIPIRYLTKYSKATPLKFYVGLVLASMTVSLIAAVILITSTIALYSYRFYGLNKLVLPSNILGVLAVTATGGVFKFLFSTALALLVVAMRKPKLLSMMSFVPFIISYGLGMYGIMSGGGLVQYSPFNIIMLLAYHYYTGSPLALDLRAIDMWKADPEIRNWLTPGSTIQTTDPLVLWLVLTAWILIFALIALTMLRIQRGVSVEEIIT
jgi:hypothetical protein